MTQEELNDMGKANNKLNPTKVGNKIIENIGEQLNKMGILPTDSNIVKFIKAFGL